MTRTVGPLLLLMLSLLCAAVSSSTSSSASLFLHPAAPGSGRPADISAAQANRVLAHLLDIPGETLGAGAGHRDAWDWITPSSSSGKQAVQSLFDDSKQRNIVLFTDLDSQDAQDVFPSQLRHTHSIVAPPHTSSFEALLHSYGEKLHAATPALGAQFGGFFTSAVDGIETMLESAADWMVGGVLPAIGEKTVDQMNLGGKASETFKKSIKDLVALFNNERHTDESEIAVPSYQALRFQGLGEIKRTYGSESDEYKQAKQILKAILEAAAKKLEGLSSSHRFAFIALPTQDDVLMPRSLDMLSPFRSVASLTPFMTTRDLSSLAKKTNDTKAPKESDFIGKCFSSEKDLNKATLNCSSHGTAMQSSKGGAKCYVCKCQQTKDKNGRVTPWAGAACQKQDVSKPFVLLLSTTLGLIFVILYSVYYLFNEGEKELPSVLAGISIPNK